MYKILLLISLLIFTGCTKIVNPDFYQNKPKSFYVNELKNDKINLSQHIKTLIFNDENVNLSNSHKNSFVLTGSILSLSTNKNHYYIKNNSYQEKHKKVDLRHRKPFIYNSTRCNKLDGFLKVNIKVYDQNKLVFDKIYSQNEYLDSCEDDIVTSSNLYDILVKQVLINISKDILPQSQLNF